MTIKSLFTRSLLSVAAICLTGVGQAADPQEGQTVTSRPRADYDPLGIRLGGFLAFPKLLLSEKYDSNLLAVDRGEDDDFITVINPGLVIKSDWNNHALGFFANTSIGLHADNNDENYEDYEVGVNGRLDIRRHSQLSTKLSFAHEHELRDSPNDVNGEDPTELDVLSTELQYFHVFNRLSARLIGSFDRLDFDDVSATGGRINNDDRDRNLVGGNLRLAYQVHPQFTAFIQPGFDVRIYDDASDDNGLDRDSEGYEIVAGTAIDLTGVVRGELFAGYTSQSYDDRNLDTISGFALGGELEWNPSGLTTVTGIVSREIREAIQSGSSGYFDTRIGLKVDHELRRFLLLHANLFAGFEDFEGIDRKDDRIGAGIGAKYLLNRNVYLALDYNYQQRDSNLSNQDFSRNSVLLSLELQR